MSSFTWKKTTLGTQFTLVGNGMNCEQWLEYFRKSRCSIGDHALSGIKRAEFNIPKGAEIQVTLITRNPNVGPWVDHEVMKQGFGRLTDEVSCLMRAQISASDMHAMGLYSIAVRGESCLFIPESGISSFRDDGYDNPCEDFGPKYAFAYASVQG